MIQRSFTKGKWFIEFDTHNKPSIIRSAERENPNDAIAIVFVERKDKHEGEANANLIACAPELYDALEKMVKAWENLAEATGEEGLLPEDEVYQNALQTLKKAEVK